MNFDLAILLQIAPFVFRGAVVTLELVFLVLVVASVLSLPLALARNARAAWIAVPFAVLSWVIRGIPPLLILFVVYFAVPQLGVPLPPFTAAVVGLTVYTMFYFAEALRAGFAAVPPGQLAASRALALPPLRTLRRIVLPQALVSALPSLISYATEVVKNSALTASIAVAETTGNAYQLILSTGRPFEILTLVAAIYAVIDGALLAVQSYAERHLLPTKRQFAP
jgi:His/Glu/Gln/Arg/opine family amino acid ABC transporter permease subunit